MVPTLPRVLRKFKSPEIFLGDVEKAKIFTRYNYECTQRARARAAAKKERKENEVAIQSQTLSTLYYFKELIMICQVSLGLYFI
jgi:hypothetical protein